MSSGRQLGAALLPVCSLPGATPTLAPRTTLSQACLAATTPHTRSLHATVISLDARPATLAETSETRRRVRRSVIMALRGRARGAGRERVGSARDAVARVAAPSGGSRMTRQSPSAIDPYSPWQAKHG